MTGVTVDARAESLPSLQEACTRVVDLAHAGECAQLAEARSQADAHRLYEERASHRERSRHFAILKLVAEAGLGILSFEHPEVIAASDVRGPRTDWRSLAAAAERGQLLNFCEREQNLSTTNVALRLRWEGWTTVQRHALGIKSGAESIPWPRAREIAKRRGMDLTAIPHDAAAVRGQRDRDAAASKRMQRVYEAERREEREAVRRATRRAAERQGQKTSIAFGLFRRAYQALDAARAEATDDYEREFIEHALGSMDRAEEEISIALGVQPEPAWRIASRSRSGTAGAEVRLLPIKE